MTSTKTIAVTSTEGESFVFRCEYPSGWKNNSKYLCRVDECSNYLIMTDKHDQWEHEERFSIYDNTSGSFFIVKVDKLGSNDSGTYWCGVDVSFQPDHISTIKLDVSQGTVLYVYSQHRPQLAKHGLQLCIVQNSKYNVFND